MSKRRGGEWRVKEREVRRIRETPGAGWEEQKKKRADSRGAITSFHHTDSG